MIKTFRWNLINAPCLPGRAGRRFLITFLWVWVQSFLRALLSGPVSKMDYLISHKSSNEYNEFYSAYVDTQHWDVSKGWETCLQHRVKMVRLFVQSWLALDEMSQTPAPLPSKSGWAAWDDLCPCVQPSITRSFSPGPWVSRTWCINPYTGQEPAAVLSRHTQGEFHRYLLTRNGKVYRCEKWFLFVRNDEWGKRWLNHFYCCQL